MVVKLRIAKATQEQLEIKTLRGTISIQYRDIEWVYQPAMINPVLISLKYNDEETGWTKKILIMPSQSSQMFKFNWFGEVEMTKFIREQAMASNPDYSKELEPSRWIPFGLIFLTGIPVLLIIYYFYGFPII